MVTSHGADMINAFALHSGASVLEVMPVYQAAAQSAYTACACAWACCMCMCMCMCMGMGMGMCMCMCMCMCSACATHMLCIYSAHAVHHAVHVHAHITYHISHMHITSTYHMHTYTCTHDMPIRRAARARCTRACSRPRVAARLSYCTTR